MTPRRACGQFGEVVGVCIVVLGGARKYGAPVELGVKVIAVGR